MNDELSALLEPVFNGWASQALLNGEFSATFTFKIDDELQAEIYYDARQKKHPTLTGYEWFVEFGYGLGWFSKYAAFMEADDPTYIHQQLIDYWLKLTEEGLEDSRNEMFTTSPLIDQINEAFSNEKGWVNI